MRLLVLGGGGFLGYHAAAEALSAGHAVTTFSRDGEAPVEGADHLVGDRTGDLSALRGREWDAVLDTFSDPEAVGETAKLLCGRVGVYGFVSGISVYSPDGPPVVGEGSPLRKPGENEGDPLQERSVAKLACEEAVREGFGGSVLVVRPGIMVGPRDPTDRFTFWPVRFARALADGLPVLAPGEPERPVQFTDARDLAAWAVGMLERGAGGTFNGVGPDRPTTLREVLSACLEAAREERDGEDAVPEVESVWAGEEFLRERLGEVEEEERPLWFPEDQIPFTAVDSAAAIGAGLRFRPVRETARDTLRWRREQPGELLAGLSEERERAIIEELQEGR